MDALSQCSPYRIKKWNLKKNRKFSTLNLSLLKGMSMELFQTTIQIYFILLKSRFIYYSFVLNTVATTAYILVKTYVIERVCNITST